MFLNIDESDDDNDDDDDDDDDDDIEIIEDDLGGEEDDEDDKTDEVHTRLYYRYSPDYNAESENFVVLYIKKIYP